MDFSTGANTAIDSSTLTSRQPSQRPILPLRLAEYAAAARIYLDDRAHIFLYNYKWLWGVADKVEGFAPHPDGIIRLQDVRFRP